MNRIPLLNQIDDVHPVDDVAEGRVERVEMRLRRVRDEELAPAGILPRERHADRAPHERTLVQLVADGVPGPALTVAAWIAVLHDEVRQDAMNLESVEKPFARERHEIASGLRRVEH